MKDKRFSLFKRLPKELWISTFTFLTAKELCVLECVNKEINAVVSSDRIWKLSTGLSKKKYRKYYSQHREVFGKFLDNVSYNFQLITDNCLTNLTYQKLTDKLCFVRGDAFIELVNDKKIFLWLESEARNIPPHLDNQRCIILCMDDRGKLNSVLDKIFKNAEKTTYLIVVVNPPKGKLNYSNRIMTQLFDKGAPPKEFFVNLVNLLEEKADEQNIKLASKLTEKSDQSRKKFCSLM
jgi:hypothetical protein